MPTTIRSIHDIEADLNEIEQERASDRRPVVLLMHNGSSERAAYNIRSQSRALRMEALLAEMRAAQIALNVGDEEG